MAGGEARPFCPACGFELDFEPWEGECASLEICPCCGIHFGYDDAAAGALKARAQVYLRWRAGWVQKGMPWWSKAKAQPPGWNPQEQVKRVARK